MAVAVVAVAVVVAMVCVKVKRVGRLHQFRDFIFRSVERLLSLDRGKRLSGLVPSVSVLCFGEEKLSTMFSAHLLFASHYPL